MHQHNRAIQQEVQMAETERESVTQEQLQKDRLYLETSKTYMGISLGTLIYILHNIEDFAVKRASERYYRIWRKTDQGFVFERLQYGRYN